MLLQLFTIDTDTGCEFVIDGYYSVYFDEDCTFILMRVFNCELMLDLVKYFLNN